LNNLRRYLLNIFPWRNIAILTVIFYALVILRAVPANGTENLYATGPLKEIDRCGSAWLIKRYIDKKAEFRFYPEGAIITEGIAFDTPDAQFRRNHRFSTFESIMINYKLKEKGLHILAEIIHDIEICAWEKRKKYRKILHDIRVITADNKTDKQRLKGCLSYFDNFLKNPPPHKK